MRRRLSFVLYGVLAALAPFAALAGDIPLDDAGFTAYIQQKVQLYSPAPVRVLAPLSIAIGPQTGANLVYDVKPLHDVCVQAPAQCPDKLHDYVQDIVRRFPSANSGPSPATVLPPDRAGFMAWVVAATMAALPGATAAADGLTLRVTRPGGHPIAFDESDYYQRCRQVNFVCAAPMRQAVARAVAWLAPADTAALRVSLHRIDGCGGGAASDCAVTPSREPMAPFFRRAFANLEEVCFKPAGANGDVPMLNADRGDLNLSVDAAFALCETDTRDGLPPPSAPSPPGQYARIIGDYAAALALFPDDWSKFAAASGGHFIIAIPTRDTLIYMAGDGPGDVAVLAAAAQKLFAGAPRAIGGDVYRWTGTGWSLATPPPSP